MDWFLYDNGVRHESCQFYFQCSLTDFGVSLPIKGPVQSQFQFLENRVQSLSGEIPYIVSLVVVISHWRIILKT